MNRREVDPRAALACFVFLASTLLFSAGCNRECRDLCTAWYDYQRDRCGCGDTDDERVRCISDYRGSRSTDDELTECLDRRLEVEQAGSANDTVFCYEDGCTPPPLDDDDSAPEEQP